jgi:ligand-binding sensor domain-containing protein
VQDADGFAWVGTQGGLHRFDGQQYTVYRQDPRDAGSLPDSFVTALSATPDRAIWVGTYSQYVARMDLATGRIRRYAANPAITVQAQARYSRSSQKPMPSGLQRRMAWTVWIRVADTFVGYWHSTIACSAVNRKALLRDRLGGLWYATAAGLYRLDRTGSPVLVGPATPLHSLLRDRSGRLWAGGSAGLFLVSDRRTLVSAWPRKGEPGGDIRALAEAPDGRLWFSVAAAGLRRFDPSSGEVQSQRADPNVPATLPEDGINALMIDRAGLLWVGGQLLGAAVADSGGARFRYLVDIDPVLGVAHRTGNSIRAVTQTRDRRLWVGTDDRRLLRYDPSRGFEDFSALLRAQPGADGAMRVMAFADAGDGRVWVATTIGLFRLDPDIPALEPVAVPGVAMPFLRSIAVGEDGSVWLGTNRAGLIHFHPAPASAGAGGSLGTAERIGSDDDGPNGLSHPTVHALLIDRRDRIWIGTGNGLDVLEPRSGRLLHFRQRSSSDGLAGNLVRALWQGPDGAIWVGSHGGLNRVDPTTLRMTQPLLTPLQGQPLPVVFSLAGDHAGTVWMGTDRGLLRYFPQNGTLRAFGLADGVQNLEFNGGAVATLEDGRLAFGGVSGLNVFDAGRIADGRWQPTLRLLSADVGHGFVTTAIDTLELPQSTGLLRLRIGALDYLGNDRIRYRYRVDGLDHGWIDNGNRSEITYTLLPSGHYLFRAQRHESRRPLESGGVARADRGDAPCMASSAGARGYSLLAALLGLLVFLRWRERRRRELSFFERIRDREERLKLALWASGDQFWDYDLVATNCSACASTTMRVTPPTSRSRPKSRPNTTSIGTTCPRSATRYAGTCAATAHYSCPSTASRTTRASGSGCGRAVAWSNATWTGARCGWRAPRATSPTAAMPNASVASPPKSCAA